MIITRYLTKEVLNAMFAVTALLLLAFLSQQMVRYLNYVAVGKIPTNILFELVSFEIPYLLAFLLPLGLYLGLLFAYGRLYADNEMTILQMCGFSQLRLIRLTLYLALMVAGVVLVLMLWVNPLVSEKRQQVMESDEATLHLIQTLMPGRFQVSPDGRYVMYVEKLSRDHERAENVFLAQEKKNEDETKQSSWMLVTADQGYQMKDPVSKDQVFVTEDGYRYEGTPGENDYRVTQFKKYMVRLPQNDIRSTYQESESKTTAALWQDYQNPFGAAELQWRFSMAIATLLLALLAVPLSHLKPRQGRYIVFLAAILIYIIYVNILLLSRRWIEDGMISISIGMWWVHALLFLFILLYSKMRMQQI